MKQHTTHAIALGAGLLLMQACVQDVPVKPLDDTVDVGSTHHDTGDSESIDRGRDIWFNNTYGGETFFHFLANHPDPAQRLKIGFDAVVGTPRGVRFDVWGVINDPDCEADPNGGPDVCTDPNASGVVGIRKFPGPGGEAIYGAACAACHAGFDPIHPPSDPNDPSWDNIHATIGNQHRVPGRSVHYYTLSNRPPRADAPRVEHVLAVDDHVVPSNRADMPQQGQVDACLLGLAVADRS